MVAVNTLGSVHEMFSVLESSAMITNEILDKLPNILIATDTKGFIFKANLATERFFNRNQKQILGRKLIDLVGPKAKVFFDNYFNVQNITSHQRSEHLSFLEETDGSFISWSVNRIESHQEYMKEFVIILGSDTTKLMNLQTSISAAEILQKALMPIPGEVPHFELCSFYQSAEETGGDFYDYFYDETANRFYLIILDVNGHGLPAALMTAVLSGAFKGIMDSMQESSNLPDIWSAVIHLAEALNKSYWQTSTRAGLLATMGLICIDVASGKSAFLNAAHHQIIKANNDGRSISILKAGAPIGLDRELEYGLKHFTMEPAETIFLFTDGLIENKTPNGDKVSLKEIRRLINNQDSLEKIKKNILALGGKDWENHPGHDDMAFILLRKK